MKKESSSDFVRKTITKKLIYGEYQPGHIFKLRELLQDPLFSSLSQTPVREALLQLVVKDILIGQRGFSIRVPVPRVEHLAEARELRSMLEIRAAINNMNNWTEEKLYDLSAIHSSLLNAKESGDIGTVLRENANFHFSLYGEIGKSYLMNMIENLWAITGPSIRLLYEKSNPFHSKSIHPHIKIIEALRKSDAEMLSSAIADDLSATGQIILSNLDHFTINPDAYAIQPFMPLKKINDRKKESIIFLQKMSDL